MDKQVMSGTVGSVCPICLHSFKVLVMFPFFNKGFTPVKTDCPNCKTELIVSDKHKYNRKGEILQ